METVYGEVWQTWKAAQREPSPPRLAEATSMAADMTISPKLETFPSFPLP